MEGHREITTARLILRPLALEHAEALHPVFADPNAMHFWHEPPHQAIISATSARRAWAICSRRATGGRA